MKMLKIALATVLILAAVATSAARAADPTPAKPKDLTVSEVLALSAALSQLDAYQTGKVDKDNRAIIAPYKFSGTTLMTIAIDIEGAAVVVRSYQKSVNALIGRLSNGGVKVPDDKVGEFNKETTKMMDAPSGVLLARIKESELDLANNPIPASVLSAMLPIIDRGSP